MPYSFTTQLRRFGAGSAAILLVIGAAACGGASNRDERGNQTERKGNMKAALGGGGGSNRGEERGNRSSDSSDRTDRTDRADRGSSEERGDDRGGGATLGQREVRIVNNSDQLITHLQGSPTNQQEWGEDRIPTTTLAAGSSVIVDFDDNNEQCRYDLRARFQDGTFRERRDVNICEVAEWIITSDGSSTR